MDRDRFTASNISAKVDLSGYSEGQVRVPILVSLINNPYNVRIVNYEPKEVLFTLDSVVTEKKNCNSSNYWRFTKGLYIRRYFFKATNSFSNWSKNLGQ